MIARIKIYFRDLLLLLISIGMMNSYASAGLLSDVREEVRNSQSITSAENEYDDEKDDKDDEGGCDCYYDLLFTGKHKRNHKHEINLSYHYHYDPEPDSPTYVLTNFIFDTIFFPFGTLRDATVDYKFPNFPYDHSSGYQQPTLNYSINTKFKEDLLTGETIVDQPRWIRDCPGKNFRPYAFRFNTEYGTDMDHLSRIGGHLLCSTTFGIGVDSEFSYLNEHLPDGSNDHLWLGDANIIFRFIETPKVQCRWGVGINWLESQGVGDVGFNLTTSADFYIARPLLISTSIDWGRLNNKIEAFQYRITLGINIRHVESYAGYQYYDIGNSQMSFMIAGARIWF